MQESASAKYLVMVCHVEPTWWDGSWEGFDEVLRELRGALEDVRCGGKGPAVTFCLTAEAIQDKADFFRELQDDGHEIGVHSHLPGAHAPGGRHKYAGEFAYGVDERGTLNQDAAAGKIKALAESRGLGQARAHVSGMFTFCDRTASILRTLGSKSTAV